MATLNAQITNQENYSTHTLRVRGLVQGVGFRPTVWRLAKQLALCGNVRNDGSGVLVNIYGTRKDIQGFAQQLINHCPPLARIDSIDIDSNDELDAANSFTDVAVDNDFKIISSQDTQIATGITADAATCSDCLHELTNPANHRYHYPFLNCTHCGPRFSIIHQIPYDRSNTSMVGFKLCQNCLAEYKNPADRRFHAQPTACPVCGPQIWLCDSNSRTLEVADPFIEISKQIKQGMIVAIKGIGGIHLACDAGNDDAVEKLRLRKNRPHKPLAMMAKNVTQVKEYCKVNKIEVAALTSSAAPIVILDALNTELLPTSVAPAQQQWGFMLPYSPLHHLLMEKLERPIVLTSGNLSEEPQCTDNDDAVKRLSNIAEFFLLHDRPIENRIDDSVVRNMNGKMQVLRHARGYAPGHIPLPAGFENHPPLLAFGGELKNTFCLLKNGQAILSQHMGDLEDARTFDDLQKSLSLYLNLYAQQPEILAADLHPEYLSTKLALEWADTKPLPLTQVQHHHAHIAACLADNNTALDEAPVIGVALDGMGFGDDGTLWGGEFLLADYMAYERLAHLKSVIMPGGAQAMREPWRNTYAQLDSSFGWQAFTQQYNKLELCRFLNNKPVGTLQHMANKSINSPLSSSSGRLFDAIAAAIGLAPIQCSYEGQAAMALEACFSKKTLQQVSPYPFALCREKKTFTLDPTPLWKALLEDLNNNAAIDIIAARFHKGFAEAIVSTAALLASKNNINRIALSGGVFQNRTLFELVENGLNEKGLLVLTHQQVPANDAGLAFGQAVVAAARYIKNRRK